MSDFLGSKQLIAIDQKIAGGCIGMDHAGMTWDGYVGIEAVHRQILVEDLLGQPELDWRGLSRSTARGPRGDTPRGPRDCVVTRRLRS